MCSMKLKQLEQYLEEIEQFQTPKIKLEQYCTMPHIAARMLHTAQASFHDIDGKVVADLGCGCGTLAIGSSLLGADFCYCFDIDEDAVSLLKINCENLEINNLDVVLCDVTSYLPARFYKSCDTVVMNPPFGTKTKGVDMLFLKAALQVARNRVYSLHKTSTRNHILKKAHDFGVKCKVLAELRYDLPSSYNFHKKDSVDIQVDFIQFTL